MNLYDWITELVQTYPHRYDQVAFLEENVNGSWTFKSCFDAGVLWVVDRVLLGDCQGLLGSPSSVIFWYLDMARLPPSMCVCGIFFSHFIIQWNGDLLVKYQHASPQHEESFMSGAQMLQDDVHTQL